MNSNSQRSEEYEPLSYWISIVVSFFTSIFLLAGISSDDICGLADSKFEQHADQPKTIGEKAQNLNLVKPELKDTLNELKTATQKLSMLQAEIRQLTINGKTKEQRLDQSTKAKNETTQNLKDQIIQNGRLRAQIDNLKATAEESALATTKLNSSRFEELCCKNMKIENLAAELLVTKKEAKKYREKARTYRCLANERRFLEEQYQRIIASRESDMPGSGTGKDVGHSRASSN